MELLAPPSAPSTDANTDRDTNFCPKAENAKNIWRWMNKLISLFNKVIDKGFDPVDFRRFVNKVFEGLLDDIKSGENWALDYFLFCGYESIWTRQAAELPDFEHGLVITSTQRRFERPFVEFKHSHLRPPKGGEDRWKIDLPHFEEYKAYLLGSDETTDSWDTLMLYVERSLAQSVTDGPEMTLHPLSTWQDSKPASSLPDSPAEPQEKSLMEKLDDLYPLVQPKIPTRKGYKVMPPWSVPMPWNFDKYRDIYDNYATISLHLGTTTKIDWPTFTIRPVLSRVQERELREMAPGTEADTLQMLGQKMLFACARLNDWVRHMDRSRQVIPLHLFLAKTALPDNPLHSGYDATKNMEAGYKEWRRDPAGYLECLRPSEVVEEDKSSYISDFTEEHYGWSGEDDEYDEREVYSSRIERRRR